MGRGKPVAANLQGNVVMKNKLALTLAAVLFSGQVMAVEFPAAITQKFSALSDEQRSFLASDAPLRLFNERQLNEAFEIRNPSQIAIYVSDMMSVLSGLAYNPTEDMGAIPLNTEATTFNNLIRQPAALWTIRRDPGPFSVHRYIRPGSGIPTFAGAPVAINHEDLIAGKVEVAFAGVPQSMSSGSRDARNAPRNVRGSHGMADRNLYLLVDPAATLNLADFGDINVDRMALERSVDFITQEVKDIADTGARPFLIGGDHSVMYSAVKGVQTSRNTGIAVVQLGAHSDTKRTGAHTLSDQDAAYRLLVEGVVNGPDLIQVGLNGPQLTEQNLLWLREQGVKYHTMAEVERRGWGSVLTRVLDEAKATRKPVFISLDVSVMDTAQMTAAGRAVPGGLTMREVMPLLRRLCAETEIAGFELADMAPMLDFTYVSALNANYLMNACLAGIALRKEGITEANYLSPLALDHGQ
jgi:arginase family enzyme